MNPSQFANWVGFFQLMDESDRDRAKSTLSALRKIGLKF